MKEKRVSQFSTEEMRRGSSALRRGGRGNSAWRKGGRGNSAWRRRGKLNLAWRKRGGEQLSIWETGDIDYWYKFYAAQMTIDRSSSFLPNLMTPTVLLKLTARIALNN